MGINFDDFVTRDVYIDYDFEEVTYRWDHRAKAVYLKFYGKPEKADPIPQDNRLYVDALRFGREITKEEYERGFARG